jgi:hypothetical protein
VVVGIKESGMAEIKRGISASDEVLLIPASGTAAAGPHNLLGEGIG